MKKAIIKFHKRTIQVIYFYSYTEDEIINCKVYRFLDRDGKMISNILLDPYEIEEGLEVEIIENEL